MDNGLLHEFRKHGKLQDAFVLILIVMDNGLLPENKFWKGHGEVVLILIVMDNGLLPHSFDITKSYATVLILIVMDNGLLLSICGWK